MSARKKSFSFDMINLHVGETVIFDPLGLEVKVSGSKTISYNGKDWTLTGFVKEYIPKRKASGTYQGPLYFSYNGRSLSDIRDEMDKLREDEE